MTIDAVFFDVGGVLLRNADDATGRTEWSNRLAVTVDELCERVWSAMGSDGVAATSAIVGRLATAFAIEEVDASQLLHAFHAHWSGEVALLARLTELKTTHTIGIIGNAGAAARWGFEAILGLHAIADDIVISAEVGLEKPDPAIYLLATERLGCDPTRCLFVDDLVPNVDGARAVGMTAIHHVSTAETLRALDDHLGRQA